MAVTLALAACGVNYGIATFVPKAQRQAMLPGTRPERVIL